MQFKKNSVCPSCSGCASSEDRKSQAKTNFPCFSIIASHISRISVSRHTSNVVPWETHSLAVCHAYCIPKRNAMMRSYHGSGFGALQSYQLAAITFSHSHWNQPCHIRPISCPKAVTAVLAVPTGINDRSCTIVLAPIRTHSPSFFSPSSSLWKLTFIFGRRVASSDWSNWSKWAASPWCTVSGEMDGRKWSEWCGATASGKKAVKPDAIGPKPCPWWPSAKQVECPSWLCWPVRSETKLLIADFKAMFRGKWRSLAIRLISGNTPGWFEILRCGDMCAVIMIDSEKLLACKEQDVVHAIDVRSKF